MSLSRYAVWPGSPGDTHADFVEYCPLEAQCVFTVTFLCSLAESLRHLEEARVGDAAESGSSQSGGSSPRIAEVELFMTLGSKNPPWDQNI